MNKYFESSEYKLSQEIDEYSPTHFSDLEKDEQSKIAALWVAYKRLASSRRIGPTGATG